MKIKILIFVFLLILKFTINSYGQDTLIKSKIGLIVKTDIFLPIYGIFNYTKCAIFGLDKLFYNRNSIAVSVAYSDFTNDQAKHYFLTKQIFFDYKFFLRNSNNYKGFFVGIYYKYANQKTKIQIQKYVGYNDYDIVEFVDKIAGIGGLGGYQFYIKNKLSIEFLLGFGYRKVLNREFIQRSDHFVSSLINQPDGRLSINIGYKF